MTFTGAVQSKQSMLASATVTLPAAAAAGATASHPWWRHDPAHAVTVAGWRVAWDDGRRLVLAHCAWCQPMTSAMVALQHTTRQGRSLRFTGGICPTCVAHLGALPNTRCQQ
jgi:hypothetical protein